MLYDNSINNLLKFPENWGCRTKEQPYFHFHGRKRKSRTVKSPAHRVK